MDGPNVKTRRLIRLRTSRRGYSLVEVLFASFVTTLVLSQTMTVMIACLRVSEATMADVELAVETRLLREKILYDVCEDGGLMNMCYSDLQVSDGGNGWGNSIEYKPKKGAKNKISLGAKKKLVASKSHSDKWLDCGQMVFSDADVFTTAETNGVVRFNMNVSLNFGSRKYSQRHQADAQIMNE